MAGDKIQHSFEIQEDAITMLDEAVEKHNLESRDNALRCPLNYCAEDGDWEIFLKQFDVCVVSQAWCTIVTLKFQLIKKFSDFSWGGGCVISIQTVLMEDSIS